MGREAENRRTTSGRRQGKADKAFGMFLFALLVRVEDCLLDLDFLVNVETLETGFLGLRETLSGLEADGMLVKGTVLAAEVERFAERMKIALLEKRAKRETALTTAIEEGSSWTER